MDVTTNVPSKEDPLCCRACLSSEGRLFNIHEYKLAEAFANITGTPVDKDKFPKHLCSFCGVQVRKCESFRDMCLRTQQRLLELKEKPNLDVIDNASHISKSFLNLTKTEVNIVECIDIVPDNIKTEPNIENNKTLLNIAGVIKKTGSITEFDAQKRALNVSVDKLNYIQKRVKRIENTLRRKIEKVNDDDNDENDASVTETKHTVKRKIEKLNDDNDENDASISETKIKLEIDFEEETSNIFCEEIKKELEIEFVGNSDEDWVPEKRKRVTKTKLEVKKKNVESTRKSKTKKRVTNKREKRKIRNPENNYMPEFDFAKFESDNGVTIVTLSKEEQLEEIAARKNSQNYLESPFKCDICWKGFNAETAYNNHRMRHDPIEGELACEICFVRYKRPFQVQRHQDVHRLKFICNACSYVSRNRTQAQTHHDMHEGKTFECQHCLRTFSKMSTYLSHVRIIHPAQGAACDECGETFVGEFGLRAHKKRSHAKKPQFKCPSCSATFLSVEALNRHTESAGEHIDKDLRPCEQCGENCASETQLQEHVEERHPKETHRCEECDMTFTDEFAFDVHKRRKHLNERPTTGRADLAAYARSYRRRAARSSAPARSAARPRPPSKMFMCEQCGRVFKGSTMLRQHQEQHQEVRTFACDLCPKSFAVKANLEIHQRTHTGEKPFQCPECPLAFTNTGNRKRHQKTAHQGIRDNVPCTICGRVLSTKSALALHVRTVHYGQPAPKRSRAKRRQSEINQRAER